MITAVLAIATCGSAVKSAWYWLESSRVEIKRSIPISASIGDAPELHTMGAQVDINDIRTAMNESCRFNKLAAFWTGISALLSAATTISGVLN